MPVDAPSPPPAAGAASLVVSAEEAGARLDAFLAARLALPRREARRLLDEGLVRVGGRRVGLGEKGAPLALGDRVELAAFVRREERRPEAEPGAPLVVLAEGEGWVVVDKPAGVPVHPLEASERGTLLQALIARRPGIFGVGEGGLRSGVVHRLDVDTSGALLFATTAPAFERLRAAFRAHRVEKRYRAVVHGALSGEGRMELTLAVATHRPARVRVVGTAGSGVSGARRTRLAWRALERLAGATLVEVSLETGFLHQIRVAFAHAGHPLLGDAIYAPPAVAAAAPRQLLHAACLAYEEIRAESPDPGDFAQAVAALRPVAGAC